MGGKNAVYLGDQYTKKGLVNLCAKLKHELSLIKLRIVDDLKELQELKPVDFKIGLNTVLKKYENWNKYYNNVRKQIDKKKGG